ncbi:MAG TPA: hypothetical protein VIF13_06515 [Hyphomicrobium sp.]|jgi:hypothetical protein
MIARLGMMLALVVLGPCQALADPTPAPPELDCSKSLEALRSWSAWLPGAERTTRDGRDIITVSAPDVWRVEITFTTPGEPAHPAVILRKFLKQVTGVWTAQSKACGYGDQTQFAELLANMKATDKALTDASRAEVDRKKQELSPLGAP